MDTRADEDTGDFEHDPFVKAMPKTLSTEDCIIDKNVHKTIEEQRMYYAKLMVQMAEEERGWLYYGKTAARNVRNEYQLDVYHKDVDWSEQPQMRTVFETDVGAERLFDSLLSSRTLRKLGEDSSVAFGNMVEVSPLFYSLLSSSHLN